MGDGPEARRDRTPTTRFESRSADWLSCTDALARVMGHARALPALLLPVEAARGMALARPVESPVTLPPWDNSAMDGYAVRGDSIAGASPEAPRTLRVTGALRAGEVGGVAVGAGEAVRIMTGTPVPEGADCVIRVEDTDAEREPGRVAVFSERDRGRNVRPAGQDMRAGETVVPRGTTLGAGQVGVLAACGLTSAEVHRRPVAAVLASGDEIAPAERFAEVAAGRAIPDTNGPMLAAAVEEAGGNAVRPGIARDTEESVREHLLRGAAQADLLITIGGASMGEGDLFKRVLDELGYMPDFWRARIRPGSPFGFGHLPVEGRKPVPVFGLPGNPASAFVTFHLFARPFISALAGHRHPFPPVVRARAGVAMGGPRGLAVYPRVRLRRAAGGGWITVLAGHQSSALVAPTGRADGLAVIPDGVAGIAEGEEVDVLLFGSPGRLRGEAGPGAE
ncbi:MAG: molybdopterin molybdotransferase MoeA [Gammaproteobacteria bacterium]|nr:molybdopterin molybdotransferase MoeA [Gammaproteobacteria bacterium]